MDRILVIIVTYNAMPWAERMLDSLRESTLRPDVFVVDNGSSDGTQGFIRERYPEVMFQQSGENLGFGKANNMGLQHALDEGYDYVYLLNQDAWVMPDTFERLVAISKAYPEYGILSPFQMNADLYHIDRSFLENVLTWRSNPDLGSDMYNQQFKDVYPAQNVMAAHWFIPRACLLKVGGFSPSFPHYGEDGNFEDRVRYKGMKIGIVPSLRVVHDRGERRYSGLVFHLMYTKFIRILSDPRKGVTRGLVSISRMSARGMMRHKSFRPLCNWMKVIASLGSIAKNRKISMKSDCAFLKTPGR